MKTCGKRAYYTSEPGIEERLNVAISVRRPEPETLG